MLKHLLSLAMMTTLGLAAHAATGDTFEYSHEGQTLTYTVTDGAAGTVEVVQSDDFESYLQIEGNLVIPQTVTNAETEYTVTAIGEDAFSFCENLTSVVIPASVTSIARYAFLSSGLTSVVIPASVTSIGDYAFAYCQELSQFTVDDNNPNYTASDGALYTKDMLTIVACPAGRTEKLTIPNTVTTIGVGAFADCQKLSAVEIPESVTTISDFAFYRCHMFTTLEIPNSVTTIGNYAVYYCQNLASVTIGNSVTTIGDYAFCSNGKLTGIKLPDTVTYIGSRAFFDCSLLTTMEIPGSVTTIGDAAFALCPKLDNFIVAEDNPDFVSVDGVVYSKDMLTLVVYPGGRYGDFAIPGTVTAIKDYAFTFCKSLQAIEIPNTVATIGNSAFWGCSNLKTLALPPLVTTIEAGAFAYCGLTSLAIPNTVTTIKEDGFAGCMDLKTLEIGSSVTSIGDNAFVSSFKLKTIYAHPLTAPELGKNVFKDVPSGVVLYVPAESLSDYSTAEGWEDFLNIKEMAAGIDTVGNNETAPAEYFNLNGVRVDGALTPGLYIKRCDGKTGKVIVR